MSSSDKLAQQYKRIRFLPSHELLLVEAFLLGIVLGTLTYSIVEGIDGLILGLLDGLFSLSIGSILSALLLAKGSKQEVLNFRRLMALVNVGMLILGIGLIVSAVSAHFFLNPEIFEKGYFLSCAVLAAYTFIILGAITDKNKFRLSLFAILQPFIIIILHISILFLTNNFYLFNIYFLIIFLLMVIASILLGNWYFSSIANVGKELLGYSGIVILQAFIEALLLDRTGVLERILKALSERDDVEIKTFFFEGLDQKGIVVAPFFHPGPFRNIGSSKMPTRIATEFLGTSVFPVVFHTPTTHERDLILKKDCDRVMDSILLAEYNRGSMMAYPISIAKSGNITATVEIFDEIPLAVISRSPLPTEDLPESVNRACMVKLAQKGYSDGIIVDAHNSMVANCTELTEEDNKDIIKALEEAIDGSKAKGKGLLKAGFANSRLENYSIKDGIGDAGIMTLVTEVNGEKGVFVSIDGNNMVVGLRDKIREALYKLGYSHVEISTTDTHVVTGHTGGEGYFPLGKAIPESDLMKKVIESIEKADSRKAECSVKFSKRKVEHVYLLGNRGLENLWKLTSDSLKVAKRGLILLVILLVAFGLFLYFLV